MRALFFLGSIGLFLTAAYNLFIELGVSSTAKQVEISQLEVNPPWNRHLTVLNAKPVPDGALRSWKQRGGVVYSEEYYIPLKDSSLMRVQSLPPRVLLKVSKERGDVIVKANAGSNPIRGIRLTKWDTPDKVRQLLNQKYGKQVAERMIIIDGERQPEGALIPLFEGIGAICLAFLAVVPWDRNSRKPPRTPS